MTDGTVVLSALAPGATLAEWKAALRRMSVALGWSAPGAPAFSAVVGADDRVLLKPNWVMHANKGPWGTAPLITSPLLVIAVAELLLENRIAALRIGDAPLQSCDVETLWAEAGIRVWCDDARARGLPVVGPLDFRRTISTVSGAVLRQARDQRDLSGYRLVDLGADSLLEPVTGDAHAFRVTQYDPDLMHARHHRKHHEYLIASEVLDSTVVINLPKLKTHKKAGMTAALKNLVGINGNKEFLPHHRVGSPSEGGDCYPRRNPFKRVQEFLYDVQNRRTSVLAKKALRYPIGVLSLMSRYHGERFGLEGAWSGNDTVWRMALDLNRALLYADGEGRLQDRIQRRELHIVDAVVAGQGDGPLASEPFALGLLLGADEAPAADWVGARLLGYDPARIPIVRESFGAFRFPLASVPAHALVTTTDERQRFDFATCPLPGRYPEGWVDCVAPRTGGAAPVGTTFNPRRAHVVRSPGVAAATE